VTEEQVHAIEEFRYCVARLLEAQDASSAEGCRYAVQMAALECQLLGVDPSRIGPDSYPMGEE
jgi:hypothetical protein